MQALVDTGSEICLAPRNYVSNFSTSIAPKLVSASGAPINSYGSAIVRFTIPTMRRVYTQHFVVADVNNVILGVNFLRANKLMVDCSGEQNVLRDNQTQITSRVEMVKAEVQSCKIPEIVPQCLHDYSDVFQPPDYKAIEEVSSSDYQFTIETGDNTPVFCHPRQLSPEKLEIAKQYFKKLEKSGIVRQGKGEWASPLHMVPKGDGKWRPCGDYRRLNNITKRDAFPSPHPREFRNKLSGCKVFSKLDVYKAYHTIPVKEDHKEKTAIVTPFGLYEYNVMGFGFRNAAACFNRYIWNAVKELNNVTAYFDDILVASPDNESHQRHLEDLMVRLRNFGLRLNSQKCKFFQKSVDFIGSTVDENGIRPPKGRIESLKKLAYPTSYKELRSRLGMFGYFACHIKDFASITDPLRQLLRETETKKGRTPVNFVWEECHAIAYDKLVHALENNVVLAHPPADMKTIHLTADASDVQVGGVLATPDGKIIGMFSQRLQNSDKNRCIFEKELLAMSVAVQHFRPWVESFEVIAFTDHKALVSAIKKKEAKSRWQASRLSLIAEYVDELRYIAGKQNVVADELSRAKEVNQITVAFDVETLAKEQRIHREQEPECYVDLVKKLLFENCEIYGNQNICYFQPYVPPKCREAVIRYFHELGHTSIRNTAKLIQSRYYWKNSKRDISEFVQECLVCQQNKVTRHSKSTVGFSFPSNRFQTVHTDVVGPLPEVAGSSVKYLLTIIDRCTGWVEAIPMVTQTAKETAKAFESWLSRFGVPLYVLTDRGTNFQSDLFRSMIKRYGCYQLRTTSYHPESNGKIERMHRTLKNILKCEGKPNDWLENLNNALFALRCLPNKEDGISPFQAVTGTMMCIPPYLSSSKLDIESFVDTMNNIEVKLMLREGTKVKKRTVSDKLLKAKEVWLRVDRVKGALETPYTGPYKVIRFMPRQGVASIELNGKPEIVSLTRLKPAILPNNASNSETQLPESHSTQPTDVLVPHPEPSNVIPFPHVDQSDVTSNTLPETSSSKTCEDKQSTSRSGRQLKSIKFAKNNDYVYY